jgi:hypothetical protein
MTKTSWTLSWLRYARVVSLSFPSLGLWYSCHLRRRVFALFFRSLFGGGRWYSCDPLPAVAVSFSLSLRSLWAVGGILVLTWLR